MQVLGGLDTEMPCRVQIDDFLKGLSRQCGIVLICVCSADVVVTTRIVGNELQSLVVKSYSFIPLLIRKPKVSPETTHARKNNLRRNLSLPYFDVAVGVNFRSLCGGLPSHVQSILKLPLQSTLQGCFGH